MIIPHRHLIIAGLFAVIIFCASCNSNSGINDNSSDTPSWKELGKSFNSPEIHLKSRPLWFWNAPLSKEKTREIMIESKEKGYYGLGILPSHGMTPAFMTPEFLDHYKYTIDLADSLGVKMYLYDEFYFPSGMAGGQLYEQYPDAVSKRLDKAEFKVQGGASYSLEVPEGQFMGAVAMEPNTLERIDISSDFKDNQISGKLPEGTWNVMIFVLNPDPSTGRRHVDYLSPDAVDRFIELTYEKYYNAFPEHFGTTIDIAFYDEPTLRWVEGGRSWTATFNDRFKEVHGFSPVILYPAMWYDIGQETKYARNLLFGFRAQMYAEGFPKTINDWCNEHGIQLTGHVDQEEVVNPVSTSSDMIKAFKYQDIPAVDQIFYYGRGSKIYKVISSAALNYGRNLVATECYGAIRNMPPENLYKEAMDQFAKGINMMEPHAVWYSDKKSNFPPNLSPSDSLYGPYLSDYNDYIGRLQCLMQHGYQKSDIAILYPIHSLQGSYHFGNGDPGLGGDTPSEADYLDVGEMLALDIRNDYSFIHPEILDSKCAVEENSLKFNTGGVENRYKVFIIPGSETISLSNLQKIKTFYDNGGVVISTSRLPEHAAEKGKDEEVRNLIRYIFGDQAYNAKGLIKMAASSVWNTGGFLPANATDQKQETAWRPSRKEPVGEWLEIDFGKTVTPSGIEIACLEESQPFAFSVHLFNGEKLIEAGAYLMEEKSKSVQFTPAEITKLRIQITEGTKDKVSISEITLYNEAKDEIPLNYQAFTTNSNQNNGKAFYLPVPASAALDEIIDQSIPVPDVQIENSGEVTGGNLTYIHKVIQSKDLYFIANSSDNPQDIDVIIRGKKKFEKWDPHTGVISPVKTEPAESGEEEITGLQLQLAPVHSVFIVAK